jgi:hypothetical protein
MNETIEWHSVHEHEPPNGNDLLLQVRMENGFLNVCVGCVDGHGDWVLHAAFDDCTVLWWAHLPEGPENK